MADDLMTFAEAREMRRDAEKALMLGNGRVEVDARLLLEVLEELATQMEASAESVPQETYDDAQAEIAELKSALDIYEETPGLKELAEHLRDQKDDAERTDKRVRALQTQVYNLEQAEVMRKRRKRYGKAPSVSAEETPAS